jgi:hypothetical protein
MDLTEIEFEDGSQSAPTPKPLNLHSVSSDYEAGVLVFHCLLRWPGATRCQSEQHLVI